MSFVNPWAIWLLAASVPLFTAFLIRRWRRQQTVSSVVIFRRLLAQTASRQRLARPHHLVALFLSMLALAALAFAASEPEGVEVEPRRYLVVFDTSASMGARELAVEGNRYTRAITQLAEFLDDLNPDDEVALITFGPESRLETGWSHDHGELLSVVADRPPLGHGAGALDAFRIADAMCQEPDKTEILLISDGANLAIPPTRCPIRYVRIGEDAVNLAITGFTVREADALGLNEIYLSIHNASDYEREVTVELELDGTLIDAATETMAAETSIERLIRLPLGDGEVLIARLSGPGENALAEDDVAFAVMRPGARVQALLLTRHPTTFLAEALRLHPRVDLTVSSPEGLDWEAGPYDLMVVDANYEGSLPHADHVIILDASTSLLGLPYDGSVREPEIIRWSFDHPLFRFVNMDGIHLTTATATSLPPGATSLMDMPDGPLIFSIEDGGQEIIYFTFHPDRSDLPLRVAFVNLVANLVEWAQPLDMRDLRAGLSTGERLSETQPGLTLHPVTVQRGATASHDARNPVQRAGIYSVESGDGVERGLIAANLFSVEEAELMPGRRLGIGAMRGWPEVQQPDPFPWWIPVMIAIGLLVLEWLLPGILGIAYRQRRRRELKSSRSRSKQQLLKQQPGARAKSEVARAHSG